MDTTTIRERVSRLAGLLAGEREALAEFISELAEFDASRAWEELGYPSLFEFLTRELRLSRGAAFYRSKAVWLVCRFPEAGMTRSCSRSSSPRARWSRCGRS